MLDILTNELQLIGKQLPITDYQNLRFAFKSNLKLCQIISANALLESKTRVDVSKIVNVKTVITDTVVSQLVDRQQFKLIENLNYKMTQQLSLKIIMKVIATKKLSKLSQDFWIQLLSNVDQDSIVIMANKNRFTCLSAPIISMNVVSTLQIFEMTLKAGYLQAAMYFKQLLLFLPAEMDHFSLAGVFAVFGEILDRIKGTVTMLRYPYLNWESSEALMMKECDSDRAEIQWNLFSFVTVGWITSLLQKGYRAPLQEQDLYNLNKKYKALDMQRYLARFWIKPEKIEFIKAILGGISWHFAAYGILQLFGIALDLYLVPNLLQQLLFFLGGEPSWISNGYWLSVLLFLSKLASTLVTTMVASFERIILTRVLSIASSAIYEKSFSLSSTSKLEFSEGKTLTMINVDAENLAKGFVLIHQMWGTPLQIGWVLYSLYILLNSAFYGALGVLIMSVFLNIISAPLSTQHVKDIFGYIDKRSNALREALMGMKFVKYMAIEELQEKKIRELRLSEYRSLGILLLIFLFTQGFTNMTPFILPVLCFAIYAANVGQANLSANVIFPAMALIYQLNAPMKLSGLIAQRFTNFKVSLDRISGFLMTENKEAVGSTCSDISIDLNIASFQYPQKDKANEQSFQLELDLKIKRGTHIAIVGNVGSGKTSVFSAILGNMIKSQGQLEINGTIAYCAQVPWIQSCTVEENIMFGNEYDRVRIEKAISASAMASDLEIMRDGIKTEIGENGVSLSGGQKSRLALARAIYSDSDIYLLDDPLSSLDSRVGTAVFQSTIKSFCGQKTVLMATHKLELLQNFDKVLLVDNGKVKGFDTFEELLEHNSDFQKIMKDYKAEEVEQAKESDSTVAVTLQDEKGVSILEEEERNTGSIKSSMYFNYVGLFGRQHLISFVVGSILFGVTYTWQNIMLSIYSDNSSGQSDSFILQYSILGSVQIVGLSLMLMIGFGTTKLSTEMHNLALNDICKVGLKTLRGRLQIVPQDPTMFSGTLRDNLDVNSKYSDHEIWNALELVKMKDYVNETPSKLSMEIANGGDNLSVGQKQLLCLARAMLVQPKILIVDEATASIDVETEKLIQKLLLHEFKTSTVIAIAHRLSSIVGFDKIMVLDAGRLVENDSPRNLLSTDSVFAELVKSSGTANEAFIHELVFSNDSNILQPF
ncbi:hypothetical protein HDV01_005983 [Terramyces sp. JEL0728]|nr:hypothetical protein HDV01_005983 [Terramyces sp. JEL0728]